MSEMDKVGFDRGTNGVEDAASIAPPPVEQLDTNTNTSTNSATETNTPEAKQVVSQAKGFLDEQLGARTRRAGEQLGQLARAVRGASEHLGDSAVAPYVSKLGEGLERTSALLREATVDDALASAESYARQHPFMFLGGALVAGLAGGRVLKSAHAALEGGLEDLQDEPRKKTRARRARD